MPPMPKKRGYPPRGTHILIQLRLSYAPRLLRDRKLHVGKSAFILDEGRKGVHFYHFPGVVQEGEESGLE